MKAYSLAVDEAGVPWITRAKRHDVWRWDLELLSWENMSLPKCSFIAAGRANEVYALAAPAKDGGRTIY